MSNASSSQQGSSRAPSSTPMTPSDAIRIQIAQAKANGGKVAPNSFGARATSAGARNMNAGRVGGGNRAGGGRTR